MTTFAGWDPKYRIKIRIITSRAYHTLFMNNKLIRATEEETKNFGKPDFTICNAGKETQITNYFFIFKGNYEQTK